MAFYPSTGLREGQSVEKWSLIFPVMEKSAAAVPAQPSVLPKKPACSGPFGPLAPDGNKIAAGWLCMRQAYGVFILKKDIKISLSRVYHFN